MRLRAFGLEQCPEGDIYDLWFAQARELQIQTPKWLGSEGFKVIRNLFSRKIASTAMIKTMTSRKVLPAHGKPGVSKS